MLQTTALVREAGSQAGGRRLKQVAPQATSQPKSGTQALLCVAASLVLLAPCFWHSRIQAGDLASHMYNSWLASLAVQGMTSGLVLVPQSTNILFDFLAQHLGAVLGFAVAEKLLVGTLVLLFFWGAMSLCTVIRGRVSWSVAPLLALAAHGWTFQMGFMNYYASLAFSFWGLAFWWRDGHWRYGALFASLLAWLAQPIGLAFLAGGIGLFELYKHLDRRWHVIVVAVLVLAVFAVRFWIVGHYRMVPTNTPWYARTGANQLMLYGKVYEVLGYLFALSLALEVGLAWVRNKRNRVEERRARPGPVLLTLLIAVLLACWLVPDGFFVPQYSGPLNFMASRMSVILLVLAAGYVTTSKGARWPSAIWVLIAMGYFALLYRDTAALNEMEDQAVQLVRQLPAGAKVVAVLEWPGGKVVTHHILDRACIGRCFSYANYEPPSRQFRLRVTGSNPIVMTNPAASAAVGQGKLIIRGEDLPLYELYQCGSKTKLCVHELEEGEANGQIVREQGWLAQAHQP